MTRRTRAEICEMILAAMPGSQIDISGRTGIDRTTVSRIVGDLSCSTLNLAHVSDSRKIGRKKVEFIYSRGGTAFFVESTPPGVLPRAFFGGVRT